jgi:two-component sensor histidine kinase
LSDIDFQKYLKQLTGNISTMNKNAECDVTLKVNASTYSFNIETAVPLGLIVNELVSNSYKHAFLGKSSGRINVEIGESSSKNYYLSIKDDGNGIQGEFDIKKSKSLGLKLVTILSRQLKGKVEVLQDNGTLFLIHFHQISKSS